MGVVSQESILFNDNVFRNIAFGDDYFDKEKVIDAAKMANAHEFILKFKDAVDRVVSVNIGLYAYMPLYNSLAFSTLAWLASIVQPCPLALAAEVHALSFPNLLST